MQSEQRISLVPLTSLCSASSLSCSRSNGISSTAGMGLDATEDLDNFYSRCLLCTCRPDVTPHIEIFSQAGNQLQLADKINKYLNIQIEAELPQNVCHSCIEQLNSTHELVMKSQKARIMLLQIKQQIENLGKEKMALDNLEPEDQSANDLAVHTSESTHETVCESTSKPPSPSPEEHMDIENVFIKQELDVEEFENEDSDVAKEACYNAESTEAPHDTLAVELAHCSQDLQTPLESVCTMDMSLEEPQIKDEIETEEFTFPQLETDVDAPSRIQVSIPASSDLPLLANPDTSFTSAVTETTSMDPYTSLIDNSTKTEILCPVCHNLCFNENLLLKHCLSIHTVTYNSMGSISYQRPFRFIHCKVEKCMWKTKFLGVDRKELISQFKVHAQINHNNMFVCEYCLAMFENREQFCDHNTQYHPKHKCEFSSSDGVCDCSSTSKVSKGTICGVAGCKWSCVTTDEKQMLSKVRKHLQLKHSELHACYYCLSIFVTAKQRQAHIVEKHMKSCNICDFQYASNTELMNHCHITHTVPNNIPMVCNKDIELQKTKHTSCQVQDCDFVTKSQEPEQILLDLKFHCGVHHKGVEICDRCYGIFPSSEQLDSHIETVHVFPCKICNYIFKTPRTLLTHCKLLHQVPSYWNSDIGGIEKYNVEVPNGSETSFVENQMVHKCLICDCTLYKSPLFAHNVTYHLVSTDLDMSQVNFTSPIIRKLQCKKCLLVFTRLYDLKGHYFKTHCIKLLCSESGKNRNFSCTICDEPLKSRKVEYIQYHYRYTHHQEFDMGLLDSSKWYTPLIYEQSSCEDSLIFHCKRCTDLCTSVNDLMLHYKYVHSCYACVKCKAVFQTEEEQMLHWNKVHFVACKLCDFKAEFGQTLTRHMVSAHNSVTLDNKPKISKNTHSEIHCRLCPDHVLSNKRSAKMHYFWFHNKYSCEYCWRTFRGPSAEHRHVHDNHMTECIHCNSKFDDLNTLETHVSSVHSNEICNFCESCGEYFNDRNALKVHRESHKNQIVKRRAKRQRQPNLLCSKCGSTFHQKKFYDKHMAHVHPVSDVNCGKFCKLCNKKYKNIMLHRYISHKEIYAKENGPKNCKQLECSFCKKTYDTISDLLRHMKRHSKYKCWQCPMQYSLLPHLKEHVSELHTNRHAYSCPVCSKLYSTEADFNLHTSFHSPGSQSIQPDLVPVLRCDLCDHLCPDRDKMEKHVRTIHIKSSKLINVKRKKPMGRKPYIKRVL